MAGKNENGPVRSRRQEFKDILEEHRKWLRSHGAEGARADLKGAGYSGADLSRIKLKEANLVHSMLRGANLGHANLIGADLKCADLTVADLRTADLVSACLACAELTGADLRMADLRGADLTGADLQDADLRGADLTNAVFGSCVPVDNEILSGQGIDHTSLKVVASAAFTWPACAIKDDMPGEKKPSVSERHNNLRDAKLDMACLRNCDLSRTRNLHARQLAGSDIAGSVLPAHLDVYSVLQHAKDSASHASLTFIALFAACLYCVASLFNMGGAASASTLQGVELPFAGGQVSMLSFSVVSPVILFTGYAYALFMLQGVWEMLSELPACFPDGNPLHKKIAPWIVKGFVRSHVGLIRKNFGQGWRHRLQNAFSFMLAYATAPLSLWYFYDRFKVGGDWLTRLHLVLFIASAALCVLFLYYALATLRGWDLEYYRENSPVLRFFTDRPDRKRFGL